jgi:tetratricopeptide (TPR) repeat protein
LVETHPVTQDDVETRSLAAEPRPELTPASANDGEASSVRDSLVAPLDPDPVESSADERTIAVQPGSAPSSPVTSTEHFDADSAINQIIDAQISGDIGKMWEAQSFLDALPKPAPGDAEDAQRLNKLGLSQLRGKSFKTSTGFFSNANKDDPSNPIYLSNLGFAEMNAGDLESAEKHIRASIALDPSRAVAWGDLALALAKQSEEERAVACLLVGYRASGGKSLGFIESLDQDQDMRVRGIGTIALSKLQSIQTENK